MRLKSVLGGVLGIASMVGVTAAPLVALAAPADGASGPWADSVVATSQGLQKDGSPVQVSRSDSSQALGAAETTGASEDVPFPGNTFYSLGFGGSITLKFDNGVSNGTGDDIQVFEVTNPSYPLEQIKVEASVDGTTWTTVAANVTRDGGADLGTLSCVHYVRLTDVSDINLFEPTADAYDVDAVKSLYPTTGGCPSPVDVKCHTFEFDDATFYKLFPNKRPGGTVNLPGSIPANVSTTANSVNIALNNSVAFNATERQKLIGWYLALQMSIYRNGGQGSVVVNDILWSNTGCFSTWPSAAITLSNGATLDGNSMIKDWVMQVKAALDENRSADYAALITLLSQVSQSPY